MLINLSKLFKDRYNVYSEQSDLRKAKQNLHLALAHENSPIAKRLAAGRLLLSGLDVFSDTGEAYKIAKETIELAPLLFLNSLHNQDKEHILPQIVGLALDAAAIALLGGKGVGESINLLEMGRGILTVSLYDLRADLRELRSKHPDLADSLTDLRRKLANSQRQADMLAEGGLDGNQVRTDSRHRASRQMAVLIDEIRQRDGFERLLLPPSEDEMLGLASKGPVVIFNISSYSCDAFIIQSSGIESLNLPGLLQSDLLMRAKKPDTPETLEWMWVTFMERILDKLNIACSVASGPWPHLWWIPTGPLTKLPLHAAGYHLDVRKGLTALDRVTSSYGSSLKAMWHGHKRAKETKLTDQPQITLVAMQDTPKARRLRHAEEETRVVGDIWNSVGICPPCPRTQQGFNRCSNVNNLPLLRTWQLRH
ncbi:hypothetical protein IL306_010511 [Fusarium sp. DS 682]|nr:hypothetical protein IL306_010511 [Fusarium sp. DS 682]